MKHIYAIGIVLIFALFTFVPISAHAEEEVDVKEIVLGHMSDAYEWHITTFGHKHISLPPPVIVKSQQEVYMMAFILMQLDKGRYTKKATMSVPGI